MDWLAATQLPSEPTQSASSAPVQAPARKVGAEVSVPKTSASSASHLPHPTIPSPLLRYPLVCPLEACAETLLLHILSTHLLLHSSRKTIQEDKASSGVGIRSMVGAGYKNVCSVVLFIFPVLSFALANG